MIELDTEIKDKNGQIKELQTKINDKDGEKNAIRNEYRKGVLAEPNFRVSMDVLDGQIADYKDQIIRLQKILDDSQTKNDKERRSLQRASIGFYIPMGGAFATFLATDYLQAIAIGAGWTAFISLTQLNKKDNQGKDQRDEESDKIEKKNEELRKLLSSQAERIDKNEEIVTKLQASNVEAAQANEALKKTVGVMAKKLKSKGVENLSD